MNRQTRRQSVIHLRPSAYVKYPRLPDRRDGFQTVAVPPQTVKIHPDRENGSQTAAVAPQTVEILPDHDNGSQTVSDLVTSVPLFGFV